MHPPELDHLTVTTDSQGRIWYQHKRGGAKELLADKDDVCGYGPFTTGPDDHFRPACVWHDKAYVEKDFFEQRGWDRARIDKYFLTLLLICAGLNRSLKIKAHAYYAIVRITGGYFYNRR